MQVAGALPPEPPEPPTPIWPPVPVVVVDELVLVSPPVPAAPPVPPVFSKLRTSGEQPGAKATVSRDAAVNDRKAEARESDRKTMMNCIGSHSDGVVKRALDSLSEGRSS